MPGRVLVVDDLVPNVKLLEAKLSNDYYEVFSAFSGQEALDKVKEVQPDIILLDIMMPEMDGFEVCRRLKADPETALIPVVMVTALSEQEDRVRGLEAGANDFITKPIDDLHLLARVRSLVRLKVMVDELRLRDRTGSELGLIEQNPTTINPDDSANILIIDDDVVQTKNICNELQKLGHMTEECPPAEAVTRVANGDYDLVIISTELDEADGLRLKNLKSVHISNSINDSGK
ncbi:MAG: response regulator [Hyphomicrobiales bacterium]|nr:response regulator [Hyphomicrobiales bacterium]